MEGRSILVKEENGLFHNPKQESGGVGLAKLIREESRLYWLHR